MEVCKRFKCEIIVCLLFCQSIAVLSGLYDYVCKEEQLFRPYLRIYQGRSGKLLKTLGPGFHLIDSSLKNLWVCINGPAFLYYAKNTTLGVVYEAPQPLVYSHTCEMQNVIPKTPQAKVPILILSLLAVLIYGNETDYRLPHIQPFTAPYLFKAGEYSEGSDTAPEPFPAHFQNATSVAVIGRSDCKLMKGQKPGIPLIFRPISEPIAPHCEDAPTNPGGPLPTCDPPGTGGGGNAPTVPSSTEIAGSICRLGFSKDVLTPAVAAPTDLNLAAMMKGLVNSEPIGNGSCGPEKFEKSDFDAIKGAIDAELKNITDNEIPKMAKWAEEYDAKVTATITALTAEIADIELKIKPTPPSLPPNPKALAKLEAKKESLNDALKIENEKKTEFPALYAKMTAANSVTPPAADANAAAETWKRVETAEEELAKLEISDPAPPAPGAINTKKIEVYSAKKDAIEKTGDVWKAFSEYKVAVAKLAILVHQVKAMFEGYTPTKPVVKKAAKAKKRVEYKEIGEPAQYEIKTGTLGECTSLPVMGGPQGQCRKGKPNSTTSCGLFKTLLGLDTSPWQDGAEWKEEVLKDIGAIFSSACPYFPNRSKFLVRLNRLMAFYLKSPEHFNLAKPAEGTSSACLIIRDWMNGLGVPPLIPAPPEVAPPAPAPAPDPQPAPGPDPAAPSTEPNLVRRPFWDQIMVVLKDCKASKNNTLVFMDRSELYGNWRWVKIEKNGTTSEHEIVPLREQADEENVFNWVIDMTWRIFATVLGICVVEHEDRIPHVASKFHSLFTEDFLNPLAETWINAKDNVIFQWIIGEFYNGEAENWATRCMEASFWRSDRLKEFRPPRSLLVNCESEYNYFIKGPLASEGGILPKDREKYRI